MSKEANDQIDWSRLYQVCVGMMGIQPAQFWDMTPREIYLAIAGFKEFHGIEDNTPMTKDELGELMELHPD